MMVFPGNVVGDIAFDSKTGEAMHYVNYGWYIIVWRSW